MNALRITEATVRAGIVASRVADERARWERSLRLAGAR